MNHQEQTSIDYLETLAFAPAHEQARALASGEVTASALLEHVLARIDRYNPQLNAVIARDDEGARQAARRADEALARGERKPLLGVPITVKEHFHVTGLVTSVGNPEYAKNISDRDAPAVTALLEAGAVLIGKTNVPLALADLQTYNSIYGVTRNPWDLSRSPGGSSGGSAAAIAAGFGALELGSDIGGSIRVPAHFTGVFGHKPTFGLVYNGGTGVPANKLTLRDLSAVGPLARSAQDLELALQVLLNRDPLASKAWQVQLPAARHSELRAFRVLLLTTWPGLPQSRSEQLVEARLRRGLKAAGATVLEPEDVTGLLPDLNAAHLVYRSLLGATVQPPAGQAPLKAPEGGRQEDAEAAWKRGPFLSHAEWLQKHEQRLQIRQQWEAFFEHVDVVLSPVLSTPALAHDHSEPKDARTFPVAFDDGVTQLRFAELFNWAGLPVLPGLPATSFPLGLDENTLPIGAQAIGPYLEDLTPIRFAALFSVQQGEFQIPPGFRQG